MTGPDFAPPARGDESGRAASGQDPWEPSGPPPTYAPVPGPPVPGAPATYSPVPGPPPIEQPPGPVPAGGAYLPVLKPLPVPGPFPAPERPPQRPAVVGMSTTMAVTASVLFSCGLGFAWLMAFAVQNALDYNDPTESGLYYLLERFHLRLRLGLAWPLFGFPLGTVVFAFCILARRRWARIAYAVLGLLACAWLAYQWPRSWAVIIWPIGYIAFCVGITWTASVTRWLRRSQIRTGPAGRGNALPR